MVPASLRKWVIWGLLPATLLLSSSWGYWAHQRIHRMAVFTLPPPLLGFYKRHISQLEAQASAADRRRYSNPTEAPRHYIDWEFYAPGAQDSIAFRYADALMRYGPDSLQRHGTLPWQIYHSYLDLVAAFAAHSLPDILRHSADLGHYVADAHVPLHTTRNYNGQLTGQHGVHGLWERAVPEAYGTRYNYYVGPAAYLATPQRQAWAIVHQSHRKVDSVLAADRQLRATMPQDQRMAFQPLPNGQLRREFSPAYVHAYQLALYQQVEQQMRAAILATGSFWLSAWVDAGQPALPTGMIDQKADTISVADDCQRH